ncbi:Uncharacterised protein [Mycobacteroides abscessus subsp. abscessus]|nr:Uncharacterised protein [Mycobacteroides abscessus subsp. abscessus]
MAGERFAAGEPDLVDAEALDADAGEADDLLGAHRGVAGHELDAFGGHAVAAAEIAEVGERDAQVAGTPTEGVEQRILGVLGERRSRIEGGSPQDRGRETDLPHSSSLFFPFAIIVP